ncbi:MAG: hypothetical protein OQK94_06190 [Gammaproteobacteria bacterium]|nr:hypothetical protein [Gammaproteobacteria bacterium]MCW8839855.1 hypothetical protein [Gammaproteobacteria bacterium]MCW8959074.1 hypothetical protein [Gammaproteobacteria bacterium]MCW8992576.1 hypothetical protein [Gammaproteobacteria bacterium]
MSIRVIIGIDERNINDIEPNWISEQIVRRQQEGMPVCAVVKIRADGIDLALPSGGCANGRGGGGRSPNQQESAIIDLWRKMHLNESQISPGNLIAFLKQVS